jgi:hypothetical protein
MGQQMVTLTEAASRQDAESNRESQSDGSGGSETASDNSVHFKVLAAAALAGISYEPSTITKAYLTPLENVGCYFPKGYGCPPGAVYS